MHFGGNANPLIMIRETVDIFFLEKLDQKLQKKAQFCVHINEAALAAEHSF